MISSFSFKKEILREEYFKTFRKIRLNEKLTAFEKQLSQIIQEHPEYHTFLESPEKYQDYEFSPEHNEVNPFLHLGLHQTIMEQVASNRPKGITAIYKNLVDTLGDAHHAEHHMMNILADFIWKITQNSNNNLQSKLNFEKNYLKQLKKLLKSGCSHQH